MNTKEKIAMAEARIAELKIFIRWIETQKAKMKNKDKLNKP